eukprot:SAG22_NODE_724_length_7634_cov_11.669808_11_plen_72_part_00
MEGRTGIKFYFNARYEMHRMMPEGIGGRMVVIEVDKNWWKTSNIRDVTDISQLAVQIFLFVSNTLTNVHVP